MVPLTIRPIRANLPVKPGYNVVSLYSQAAAYGNDNLYADGIKNFNRVNYEEGFDIKFLKNRLSLTGRIPVY